MGGGAWKRGLGPRSSQGGYGPAALNPVLWNHENLLEVSGVGKKFQRRVIDPDIIASPNRSKGSLWVPLGECGEDDTIGQGQDLHRACWEILQPILVPVAYKNILCGMAAMLIPIEEAISARLVPISILSAHIFDRVPFQGEKKGFSELTLRVFLLQPASPRTDGFFSFLLGEGPIAHPTFERLPVALRRGRLAKSSREKRQTDQYGIREKR